MNRPILLALFLATAACSPAGPGKGSEDAAQTPGSAAGIVAASMDKAVAPGTISSLSPTAPGQELADPEDRSGIGAFFIADQERERQTRELLTGFSARSRRPEAARR